MRSPAGMVSVVIAAYNEELHLAPCLDSLLEQSYNPLEIIVVDDGSTDGTAQVALSFAPRQVKLLRQAHSGPAIARNLGASQAIGAILVFVDADMALDRRYIEELVRPIREQGAIGSCHDVERIANGLNPVARCWGEKRPRLGDGYSFVFRAIRRDAFMGVCGFSPELGHFDDHSLFFKLGTGADYASGAIAYHNNPDSFRETFIHARWIGRGYSMRRLGLAKPSTLVYGLRSIAIRLSRFTFPVIILGYLNPIFLFYALPYAMVILWPPSSRAMRERNWHLGFTYFAFQFVESAGWLMGYLGRFASASNVK